MPGQYALPGKCPLPGRCPLAAIGALEPGRSGRLAANKAPVDRHRWGLTPGWWTMEGF